MHTVYTGERVRLRPFTDKEEILGLWDELHTVPNEFWGPWWDTRQTREKKFEDAGMIDPGKYSMYAMERVDTGELVGYEEHGGMEHGAIFNWFGTFIKPEHWSNGFGIEAKQLCMCYLFENYPLMRLDTATLQNHKRARAGLIACGMYYEGAIRGYHYSDGRYWDMVCYAINREEWETLPIRKVVKRG